MAYRIKGMLTKKEREGLISFVEAYDDVLNDESVDKASREALRKGFMVIVTCIRIILYADNNAILGRVIGTMRNGIRQVSKKRKEKLPEYNKLVGKLRTLCGNKSELSGDKPNWQFSFKVEPHHVCGRTGPMLTDPFNIIMLTSPEHQAQDGNSWEDKLKLLALIRPIRLKQGFKQTMAYINPTGPYIYLTKEKLAEDIKKAGE